MEEDWETGAAATEDWVEGGGCWEPAWVDWELAAVVVPVVAGMALVGVKEERLVAIFWAARRAVIAANYRARNGQVSRL